MDAISEIIKDYEQAEKTLVAPHELADTAARLCDKMGIEFDTTMLKCVKVNRDIAEAVAAYTAEKGIKNIHYFVKVFWIKVKENKPAALKKSWLCKDCARIDKHFHLAGIGISCAECGKQAFSYYQKANDSWQPAIIFRAG